MKVLMLNTFEKAGGAARAFQRIAAATKMVGVDVELSSACDSNDRFIQRRYGLSHFRFKLSEFFEVHQKKLYPRATRDFFSSALLGTPLKANLKSFDLIHLHWITGGFLTPKMISEFPIPVVWTLHDMWAFTGGCHYTRGCEKYLDICENCPILKSNRSYDLSRFNFNRKMKYLSRANIHFVSPSHWLDNRRKESQLARQFPSKVIANPVELDIFFPQSKIEARRLLNLDLNKRYLLIGADHLSDERKGVGVVYNAILDFLNQNSNFTLLTFGDHAPQLTSNRIINLGKIGSDGQLSQIYNAADTFLLPSLQDNLPNTAIESIACGTPVIAFNIGGIPDIIDHTKNGYLAKAEDVSDFVNGLKWIKESSAERVRVDCRSKAESDFSPQKIGLEYKSLYEKILSHP